MNLFLSFARKAVGFCLSVCILASAAFAGQSAKHGPDSPDQKELLAYNLSMEKIQRLADTYNDMQAYQQKHPETAKDDQAGGKDISDQVAKLETKDPEAVAIIKKHGFTTREFIVAMFTLIQATMIVGSKRDGHPIDSAKANEIVNSANQDLVDKNWDAIQKINESMTGH
jgi:hypothetical protein